MALPPLGQFNPNNITAAAPPAGGSTTLSANYGQTSGVQNVADVTSGTGQNRAFFSPEQLAAQSGYFNNLGGFISGTQQVPAYMTAPPQVFQAYNDAFNKFVAPGIAAQYGAGSPQIGAQQSFGNEQLAAQLYQSGITNWMDALGLQGNAAFNPQGQNSASSALGNKVNQSDQSQWNVGMDTTQLGQSLLSLLLSGIKG